MNSRAALVALVGLPLILAGCPTIKLISADILSFKKNVVTLQVLVEVDNTANDAGEASSNIALGLPAGWSVEDVRYQIPDEPVPRRARTAPGLAALNDWTWDHPEAVWWGYHTAEHTIPSGVTVYPLEITVRVPKKTTGGFLVVVVGDPGPEAVLGAWQLTMKPKAVTSPIDVPTQNPDSAVPESTDGANMEDVLAGLGEGFAALGDGLEDLGEAGEALQGLGTLFGFPGGDTGFRAPWIEESTVDGVFHYHQLAISLPVEWSILGDPPPAGEPLQLALITPGAAIMMGTEIHQGMGADEAQALFERETATVKRDLVSEGYDPSIEDIQRTTPGGLKVLGREFRHAGADGEEMTLLMYRTDPGGMVLAVTVGPVTSSEEAGGLLDQLFDSVVFSAESAPADPTETGTENKPVTSPDPNLQ